jgi:hypothetical protein
MSRPARGQVTDNRERLKLEFTRATLLRDLHPQLAEVRIEFEFEDGTRRQPSPQAFSYFPSARGFFRYACPCHSCSGEFDLSGHVADLAKSGSRQRSRRIEVACEGLRAPASAHEGCPICARIRISAVPHAPERQT